MKNFDYIEKYLENKLSSKELAEFENILDSDPNFKSEFEDFKIARKSIEIHSQIQLKNKFKEIHKEVILRKPIKSIYKYALAASILILVGIGVIQLNRIDKNQNSNKKGNQITEVIQNQNEQNNVEKEQTIIVDENANEIVSSSDNEISNTHNSQTIISDGQNHENNTNPSNNANVEQITSPPITNNLKNNPVIDFGAFVHSGCSPFKVIFYDSSQLNDSKIVKYLWEFGDGIISHLKDPTHIFKKSGSFSISLTLWDDKGNKYSKSKSDFIIVKEVPEANFSSSRDETPLSEANIFFTNKSKQSTLNTKYFWDFGDKIGKSNKTSPTYNYKDTGIFIVRLIAKNELGCSDTMYKKVKITESFSVFCPDAFIPSSNTVNSTYKVVVSCEIKEFQLLIFDRKGTLLYRSDDYDTHGWDGTSQLGEAPVGVYVYKLNVISKDGNKFDQSGTITLVR